MAVEKCLCGHVHPAPVMWGSMEDPQYDYSCGECPCLEHEDANELGAGEGGR